jgi:hypothetical protein
MPPMRSTGKPSRWIRRSFSDVVGQALLQISAEGANPPSAACLCAACNLSKGKNSGRRIGSPGLGSETLSTMNGDGASPERHADLARQKAALAAAHASLNLIESELRIDEARRRREESRLLREQLVAARDAKKAPERNSCRAR